MKIHHENISRRYTISRTGRFHRNRHHWHQRMEFVYVLDGECRVQIGKESHLCKQGDLAVVHSGEIHALDNMIPCDLYICTFDPCILYHFQPKIQFVQSYLSGAQLREKGIDGEIRRIFDEMHEEKEAAEACSSMLIQSDIVRLYSLLVRHFERQTQPENQSVARFESFQQVLRYITENYTESITLSQIAKEINYTPAYVSTLFVTYAGVNFKNYLDSFRIGKAVELVKYTDLTVPDVAASCGYENVRTFQYAFKRITGQAPSEMRKSNI